MSGARQLTKGEYYDLFFKIRTSFNNNTDAEYDKFLHESDQALRNIGMYLIENYKGDYSNCVSNNDCTQRCTHLNLWLKEKKSIYTSNGKCTFYNKLWEEYIEKLWDKLDESMQNPNKCTKDANFTEKTFPDDKISVYCNLSPSDALTLTCQDKAYFTHLGEKIKNIIKNKIKIGNHMDEQNNEELLRNSENETMSINRMYHITYNTPEN
ncbi:PIR Superfamily Protein [Plasmodium ovale curtisi]|uniref:PIR Superfamily Protein n=1 Tax=Plasmodium ovale curtisi TaxID=864141 RepID=A0A1A8VW07_PLAOA|nr:PIR Superfamily Protein [Plasmodium ovale curtisi]